MTSSPCAGKTAVEERLFESYESSAYFDSGWAWYINPSSTAEPRLRNDNQSMSFALSNYLNPTPVVEEIKNIVSQSSG